MRNADTLHAFLEDSENFDTFRQVWNIFCENNYDPEYGVYEYCRNELNYVFEGDSFLDVLERFNGQETAYSMVDWFSPVGKTYASRQDVLDDCDLWALTAYIMNHGDEFSDVRELRFIVGDTENSEEKSYEQEGVE